jgi:hypothetical protein
MTFFEFCRGYGLQRNSLAEHMYYLTGNMREALVDAMETGGETAPEIVRYISTELGKILN